MKAARNGVGTAKPGLTKPTGKESKMAEMTNSTSSSCTATAGAWETSIDQHEQALAAAVTASARADQLDQIYAAMKPVEPARGLVMHSRGQCFSIEDAKRNAIIEREAWADACANLRGLIGLDAAHEECDRLWAIEGKAESDLMQMPAPDLNALKWKLDRIIDTDKQDSVSPWSAEYVAQTRADIARLMTN